MSATSTTPTTNTNSRRRAWRTVIITPSPPRENGAAIPGDYQVIHDWLDGSQSQILADFRHRGITPSRRRLLSQQKRSLWNDNFQQRPVGEVPVRLIAEQHIIEDLGRIPSFADWVRMHPAGTVDGPGRRLSYGRCGDVRRMRQAGTCAESGLVSSNSRASIRGQNSVAMRAARTVLLPLRDTIVKQRRN